MIGPSSDPALRITGEALRRLVPDLTDRDVYLCASPGLASAVRDALRDAGLPRRRLHQEAFAF
jgi:ferredoxin-NADP reductase